MPSVTGISPYDPASIPVKQLDAFHKLVQDLSDILGPSSGLDSEDVDPLDIQHLMEKYISRKSEWERYALKDPSRTFTRNLVDRGNGKSNLVCGAWVTKDYHDYGS